jgi:hypothetical protein
MADALIKHADKQFDGARHFLSSPVLIPGTMLLVNTMFPLPRWGG